MAEKNKTLNRNPGQEQTAGADDREVCYLFKICRYYEYAPCSDPASINTCRHLEDYLARCDGEQKP